MNTTRELKEANENIKYDMKIRIEVKLQKKNFDMVYFTGGEFHELERKNKDNITGK